MLACASFGRPQDISQSGGEKVSSLIGIESGDQESRIAPFSQKFGSPSPVDFYPNEPQAPKYGNFIPVTLKSTDKEKLKRMQY
jgi:hypothetical protein